MDLRRAGLNGESKACLLGCARLWEDSMDRSFAWLRAGCRAALLVVTMSLVATLPALAQPTGPAAAPTTQVASEPLPPPKAAPAFDPDKATNAYLARISGAARARSDAYFEGGYVLTAVDAFYAIAVSALLLFLRISSRMRKMAERMTRSRFLQAPIYIVQYLVITTVLSLPLSLYEGYFREHEYGLSNQNMMQWARDFGVDFLVNLVAFAIVGTLVYAAIRATRRFWWVWGSVIAVVFLVIGIMISPVYIAPLFNTYKPLADGPLKQHVLSLARSEGIPVTNVYQFDESKQDKRMSANVSGMFSTIRISMNDNLLNRGSEREILAVLGHEMGHYVLDHSSRLIVMLGLVILLCFAFTAWGFEALTRVFGGVWDVRGVDDPAGAPVLMALFAFFFLLATPVTNTITRTTEAQADIFGINAARQPDGFAEAALHLSEYRKLDPTPLEEFVFYDHPSGRNRIHMMMVWKAEHLNDPDIKAGPVSPQ
jgi:STE24 endopeptidase